MTTPAKFLLAAPLALALSATVGCDSEAPTSATDYRAIAHVDLDAAGSAPWVKKAIGTDSLDIGGDLGPCADIVDAATSVTVGHKEGEFEVYVTGKLEADKADACADHIEKMAKKSSKHRSGDEPEAVILDDDLFAIYHGTTPSRARFETLLAADPSPSGKPMWVVAQPDAKTTKAPFSYVQAWADTAKGFNAHVDVQLKDETTATELYGKAMLGLAAVQMSGEADELVKGLKLSNRGDTLTADMHVSPKDMTSIISKGQAKAKARVEPHDGEGKGESSVTISIGTEG